MLRLAILPRPPGPLNPGMPTSLGPKRELQDACEYKCSAVFKLPAKVHTDTWACRCNRLDNLPFCFCPY